MQKVIPGILLRRHATGWSSESEIKRRVERESIERNRRSFLAGLTSTATVSSTGKLDVVNATHVID